MYHINNIITTRVTPVTGPPKKKLAGVIWGFGLLLAASLFVGSVVVQRFSDSNPEGYFVGVGTLWQSVPGCLVVVCDFPEQFFKVFFERLGNPNCGPVVDPVGFLTGCWHLISSDGEPESRQTGKPLPTCPWVPSGLNSPRQLPSLPQKHFFCVPGGERVLPRTRNLSSQRNGKSGPQVVPAPRLQNERPERPEPTYTELFLCFVVLELFAFGGFILVPRLCRLWEPD